MLITNMWQLKTPVFPHWCLIRAVPFKLLLIKIQVVQVNVKGGNESKVLNPVQSSSDQNGTTLYFDAMTLSITTLGIMTFRTAINKSLH
jgi:hypothetical protein